jgi:hypothetical protein
MRVLAATLWAVSPSIKRIIALTSIYDQLEIYSWPIIFLNIGMTTPSELIEQGNAFREARQPEKSLECYAQAFVMDRTNPAAFNNYGNVLREVGDPMGAIPFLERAISLAPHYGTAKFNLAVCHLLLGDYKKGWPAYETRWEFEHLNGMLPNYKQPRWTGQELKDKTILVVGEQGHGDNIQFVRFVTHLKSIGAKILLQTTAGLVPMFNDPSIFDRVGTYTDDLGEFDYWTPIMSIPGVLGITLDNLPSTLSYLAAPSKHVADWAKRLGPKTKLRAGIAWSGRKDSWINNHKAMPFEKALELIKNNPQCSWINLQVDASEEEQKAMAELGVLEFPGTISTFVDTAALLTNLDVVISVDTAIAHLAGALARPTWVMLNDYAVDWRWLLNRNSSPWYPSAILFRQDGMDNWDSVVTKISNHLKLFKI